MVSLILDELAGTVAWDMILKKRPKIRFPDSDPRTQSLLRGSCRGPGRGRGSQQLSRVAVSLWGLMQCEGETHGAGPNLFP